MKLKISKKSIIIASIIVALAGTGLIYYLSTKQSGDVKAWADSNWIYRKSLQVENTGSTVSNEDVLVTVDTATLVSNLKLQADCDDLRFVDSDDSTYLDYWIEDGCNTTSTKIWVRIPTLNSGGETIYMYYGNSSATTAQETWSGNVMMYADTTCPTGWTQASELNNKFLYGSSTYGTTGGSDTSTHSNAVCTSDSISTTSIAGTTGLTGYTIHKFTSSGTLVVSEGVTAEILVVGGGGGGGSGNGGGGGAGGVVYSSSYSLPAGSYTVTIGSGGSGGSSCGHGGNGGNTSLGGIAATGGGGGAGYSATATSGGSGGGGSGDTYYTGGSGTSGQGNSGGTGVSGGPAGGGGATGVGGNGTSGKKGGNGGSGVTYSISGSSVSYAGGGGGGTTNAGTIGTGSAGGGNGGYSAAGGSATANTGSGGGGSGGGACYVGGRGGSGIVIIRYNSSAKATGGTITTYNYTNNQSVSTTHTHTSLTSTIDSSSSLPQYENMVVCYSNQFLVSSGLISLFTETPSTGWTRFSGLDNIFARVASTYGTTGGSSTHSHTTTGAITANTEGTIKSVPSTGAVGGTITYSGNYTIHTFTSGGTFFTPGGVTAEILVIGGGGGGGAGCGGGGGAGGVIYSSSYSISAGSYPITIGSGGSQGSLSGRGGNGGNTYLGDSLVAIGGGGGAGYNVAATSGGSGGGGSADTYYTGGSGTSGQGNSGGTGVTYGPGGGGGATGVGGNGTSGKGGNGGSGVTYSISGSSLGYAGGGGGGGSSSGTIGIGSSGGGNGGKLVAGVAGTANTGGGGGGGGGGADYYGGAGGSGIVIIRYLTSSTTATSSSHTHTTTNSTTSSASNIPPYLTMIFAKADSSVYANENNILMTSSVPPLGWNRFTALDNKFAMGSSTYGTTGGVTTHTHTVTNTTGGPSSTTSMRNYGSLYFADSTHTHSCTVTTQSASSFPSYYSVIYMQRKISKVVTMGIEETDNVPPNTPTLLLTESLTNPTGILDLTPEFSAVFSDTDSTDTGDYYQIQVNTASDFTGTSMWDSTKTAFGTPIVNGSRSSDISYVGTSLSYGTTYYWRIKFWDNNDTMNESSWSSTAQFVVNYIPNQPSSLLTEGQTNPSKTSLSPYFSAIFTDNDTSDTATYYQILVNSSSDFTGTEETEMVKDIYTGTSNSSPTYLTAIGDTLYFAATNGTNGIELWKSDGTAEGTVMVKDIYSGNNPSSTTYLTALGNTLYFSANNGTNGQELWKSDGTEAGTVMVKDIYSGSSSSSPSYLTAVGDILYFRANNGTNGYELWKSDGSSAGTVMVKDIYAGSSDSLNTTPHFTAIGDTVYFSATDGTNGLELWKSDGTDAGTVMVKDIYAGSGGNLVYPYFTAVVNILYFAATNGANGRELWKSDGTEAGTIMVKDISSGSGGSLSTNPYFTAVGSTLYFSATNGWQGIELWKSDGTDSGTVMIKDINPGSGHSSPTNLTVVDNTLYFQATNGTNGYELWKSDGTEAGTVMVKDIYIGSGNSAPTNLTVVGDTLYFQATDGINGIELWKSDGTEAGTVMVSDIYSGSSNSSPSYLTAVGNTLYFSATDGTNGTELWKTGKFILWDSTKTVFGTPITNGNRSSDISYAGTTLESGTTYFWKIKFWDNNDQEGTYSDTATFTTTGVPSAPTDLLTNGQTNPTIVNDYTPYFSAIYSDINGDNAKYYEIEINTNSSFTGTVIWDTDKTSTTITSGSRSPNYESASLGNIETTYYWRIRFWDSDDNISEWSSTASFTTSSTHFLFEGLKMGGIKLN